jgi:hypothetical protein
MTPTTTLALIGLRAAALALSLQGQETAARTLHLLADSVEAGKNVDAHMAEVAAKLKAGEAIDWDDLRARIEAAGEALHAPS